MMKNKCTILINSCDAYEELWDPFFKLFNLYWNNCSFRIVLNTESKRYINNYVSVETFSLFEYNSEVHWGERMIQHLNAIDSEYVLIMLDDFFIRKQVNQDKINQCIQWMDEDENICVFSFEKVLDKNNIKSNEYTDFEMRPQVGPYKFNLQAGLWRTKELASYIEPQESPWAWEVYGNLRSFNLNKEFYVLDSESNEKIIDYGFNLDGMGVYRGKWVLKDVEPLFKSHNIKVDFNKRGIYKKPFFSVSQIVLILKRIKRFLVSKKRMIKKLIQRKPIDKVEDEN